MLTARYNLLFPINPKKRDFSNNKTLLRSIDWLIEKNFFGLLFGWLIDCGWFSVQIVRCDQSIDWLIDFYFQCDGFPSTFHEISFVFSVCRSKQITRRKPCHSATIPCPRRGPLQKSARPSSRAGKWRSNTTPHRSADQRRPIFSHHFSIFSSWTNRKKCKKSTTPFRDEKYCCEPHPLTGSLRQKTIFTTGGKNERNKTKSSPPPPLRSSVSPKSSRKINKIKEGKGKRAGRGAGSVFRRQHPWG